MPRFDDEGFNPDQRIANDERDRTVPVDMVDLSQFGLGTYPKSPVEQPTQPPAPQPKPQKARKKKTPLKGFAKSVVAILLVFVVIVAGACSFANGIFNKITYDDYRKNQYVSHGDLERSSNVKNILLLGVDARDPNDDTKSRSDSMMLVSVDKKNGCIKMVSFLRDTWVFIPAKDGKQRLNAACSVDGYNGVVDTIEYNFGVDIDGYVVADFSMFKVIIDAIGGVDVEISEREAKEVNSHPKRYGKVKLEAGKHKLNGAQALAYCRIRKIDTDFMRAYRQRIVIQSILKGVKSASPVQLAKIAKNSAPYIETNLSKTKIISFAIAALPCLKGDMLETRVPFDGTWNYSNIGSASVITIDKDENKQMLVDYLYNKTPEEIKAEQKD